VKIDLDPNKIQSLLTGGNIILLDIRHQDEFATCHPRGSISIVYSEKGLVERTLNILPMPPKGVVILGKDKAQIDAACMQFENENIKVIGVAKDGIEGWVTSKLPSETLEELSINELINQLKDPKDLQVLDVREPIEWEMGHIPGAKLISLGDVSSKSNEIAKDKPLAVICEAGVRSCTAASLLLKQGFTKVYNVPEGTSGYRNSGEIMEFTELED
jgi:hydroxyacylglutathione hydrolase